MNLDLDAIKNLDQFNAAMLQAEQENDLESFSKLLDFMQKMIQQNLQYAQTARQARDAVQNFELIDPDKVIDVPAETIEEGRDAAHELVTTVRSGLEREADLADQDMERTANASQKEIDKVPDDELKGKLQEGQDALKDAYKELSRGYRKALDNLDKEVDLLCTQKADVAKNPEAFKQFRDEFMQATHEFRLDPKNADKFAALQTKMQEGVVLGVFTPEEQKRQSALLSKLYGKQFKARLRDVPLLAAEKVVKGMYHARQHFQRNRIRLKQHVQAIGRQALTVTRTILSFPKKCQAALSAALEPAVDAVVNGAKDCARSTKDAAKSFREWDIANTEKVKAAVKEPFLSFDVHMKNVLSTDYATTLQQAKDDMDQAKIVLDAATQSLNVTQKAMYDAVFSSGFSEKSLTGNQQRQLNQLRPDYDNNPHLQKEVVRAYRKLSEEEKAAPDAFKKVREAKTEEFRETYKNKYYEFSEDYYNKRSKTLDDSLKDPFKTAEANFKVAKTDYDLKKAYYEYVKNNGDPGGSGAATREAENKTAYNNAKKEAQKAKTEFRDAARHPFRHGRNARAASRNVTPAKSKGADLISQANQALNNELQKQNEAFEAVER